MFSLNGSKVTQMNDNVKLSNVIITCTKRRHIGKKSYNDIIQSIAIIDVCNKSYSKIPKPSEIDFLADDIYDAVKNGRKFVFKVDDEDEGSTFYVKITNDEILIALGIKNQ